MPKACFDKLYVNKAQQKDWGYIGMCTLKLAEVFMVPYMYVTVLSSSMVLFYIYNMIYMYAEFLCFMVKDTSLLKSRTMAE
jgi:hypothetical protein